MFIRLKSNNAVFDCYFCKVEAIGIPLVSSGKPLQYAGFPRICVRCTKEALRLFDEYDAEQIRLHKEYGPR